MKENKKENIMKGISTKDFPVGDSPTIHVGGAHELFQRVIQ